MPKNLVPHIKKFYTSDPANDIETLVENIASNLEGSGETPLVAQGVILSGASVAVHDAIAEKNTAVTVKQAAVKKVHTKVVDACTKGNASAVIMEQLHPNDPDYWKSMGYPVTMEEVPATTQAGQPLHCSASQSDNLGEVDLHNDPVANADSYRDYVTKGPVADRSQYIEITNHEGSTTSSSRTSHLPADYLNVPLNFITVGVNTLGSGIESVPYGGGRRIQ